MLWDSLGKERRAGQATYQHPKDRHETVVRRSAFTRVEILEFETTRELSIDEIMGFQLSTSYASPAQLGDKVEAFRNTLKRELTRSTSQKSSSEMTQVPETLG